MAEVYTDLERALNPSKPMDFCEAVYQLRFGHVVRREGWPKTQYLKYYVIPTEGDKVSRGIYMCWPSDKLFWDPKQEDITAEDWLIVH